MAVSSTTMARPPPTPRYSLLVGPVGKFVEHPADVFEEPQHFRLRVIEAVALEGVRIVGADALGLVLVLRSRRVVAQQRVVEVEVHGVEPEPVDAAVEPEAHVSSSASWTSGLWKLRSGCSARKLCR